MDDNILPFVRGGEKREFHFDITVLREHNRRLTDISLRLDELRRLVAASNEALGAGGLMPGGLDPASAALHVSMLRTLVDARLADYSMAVKSCSLVPGNLLGH